MNRALNAQERKLAEAQNARQRAVEAVCRGDRAGAKQAFGEAKFADLVARLMD